MSASATWLKLAPKPRVLAKGLDWDAFISYRSVNRAWALALHDTLREAGFKIFLDQFVLRPGVRLDTTLSQNLEGSNGAVLVWTQAASESEWVLSEYDKMRALAKKRKDFFFVVVKLDEQELPLLDQQTLFVDFNGYPEGPRGGGLLRLMFGLVGQPLTAEAVKAIQALDEETRAVLTQISTAKTLRKTDRLLELGLSETEALCTTPLPGCVAAEALIAIKAPDEALKVLEVLRARFPRSVRPRQLAGLAYRRTDDALRAQEILLALYAEGHRDPETLGILGATWMLRHKQEGRRIFLENSQALYEEAFTLFPTDSYVGINAASKLALMGEKERAQEIASRVLDLVKGDTDGTDYWKTVTHAEAQFLAGDIAGAAKLYRVAVKKNHSETGSIQSTRDQVLSLAAGLGLADTDRKVVLDALDVS